MQNRIINSFVFKTLNIFIPFLNMYWVDFGECCVMFLGAKVSCLNFTDMYSIQLKVLCEYN